jgi:hypothetical protein
MDKARRETRALYDLKPLCFLRAQRQYFYATLEDHFDKERDTRNLENWVETYRPMIEQDAKLRQDTLRRRLRPIDEIFRSMGNTAPDTALPPPTT